MKRRQFLRQAGVAASVGTLAACAGPRTTMHGPTAVTAAARLLPETASLAPVRASVDRITGVYVCTRPFRAAGPRIESERLGEKTIVHNYGHGGSGWSLSWGSGMAALRLAQATDVRELGVIGCGALGLTSALLAQRAGLSVRIYAKALPPDVFSMRASGLWTPDSRICDAGHAPAFGARWEALARSSFAMYQTLLGLPGQPVEWIDGYALSDQPPGHAGSEPADEPAYGDFGDRVRDLTPHGVNLPAGATPFPQRYVRRYTTMMFNITSYARLLLDDFLRQGGSIVVRDFAEPGQLLALPERTLINATGYGARALFGDQSIVPVRGQTARLIPQPEVNYAVNLPHLSMVPRREGLLVQVLGDIGNFNNPDLTPDRAASEAAVKRLADLYARMHGG